MCCMAHVLLRCNMVCYAATCCAALGCNVLPRLMLPIQWTQQQTDPRGKICICSKQQIQATDGTANMKHSCNECTACNMLHPSNYRRRRCVWHAPRSWQQTTDTPPQRQPIADSCGRGGPHRATSHPLHHTSCGSRAVRTCCAVRLARSNDSLLCCPFAAQNRWHALRSMLYVPGCAKPFAGTWRLCERCMMRWRKRVPAY